MVKWYMRYDEIGFDSNLSYADWRVKATRSVLQGVIKLCNFNFYTTIYHFVADAGNVWWKCFLTHLSFGCDHTGWVSDDEGCSNSSGSDSRESSAGLMRESTFGQRSSKPPQSPAPIGQRRRPKTDSISSLSSLSVEIPSEYWISQSRIWPNFYLSVHDAGTHLL